MENSLRAITDLVTKYLPEGTPPGGPDTDLRAAGLGSMGIVALLADVEREFGVQFSPEHITPATFATVRSLHAIVVACGSPAATQP